MNVNVFTFFVLGAGLLASETMCIAFAVIFTLFGGSSAITLTALGGSEVTPSVLFLPFLLLHALFARMRTREPLMLSRAGTLLFVVVAWGVTSAAVMPRVFDGETQVFILDRLAGKGLRLYGLRPLTTNLTQSVYLLGHFACFLSFRTLLRGRGRLLTFRNAVLLVAALNIFAAVLNLVENLLHLPSLLDYLRNAGGYSLALEYSLGGLPRIHGTMPEASLFAYYSLPLFAFTLSLWTARAELRYSPALCCMLLVLLLMSTSATAYIGLFCYCAVYTVMELPRKRIPNVMALAAACCILPVLAIYALELDAMRQITGFVNATILDKADSGSGVERASWDAQAFRNFLDTKWLGAGLGSARASSFPLVLLSNVGVFGTAMFGVFVLNVCRAPYLDRMQLSDGDFAIRKAASDATLAGLFGAMVAIGMFDLGVAFYLFAAAASSINPQPQRQSAQPGDLTPSPA
jgi:hypothetical protein